MSDTTYHWRAGFHRAGDAQAIGGELERIRERCGSLTPGIIVQEAKAKRSPLHAVIYDGTTAEEALAIHRLERAEYLLRSISIIEGESETVEVRGFYCVNVDGANEYVDAIAVRSDTDLRAQVRDRLLCELVSLKRQLDGWEEFSSVVSAIEGVVAIAA